MKYIFFSPNEFHVFEDRPAEFPHERRLTVSARGWPGCFAALDEEISPDRLKSILCSHLDIFMYRHIRLLFCHSADKEGWFTGSFAEKFSRLLPAAIIEAYLGTLHVRTIDFPDMNYKKISRPNANYHIDYEKNSQGKYIGKGAKQTLMFDFEPKYATQSMFPTNSDGEAQKACFESTLKSWEEQFETCDPVCIKDILSSRLFFCKGQSSENIKDFLYNLP
ncbi:hypothetical protein FE392_05975 [Xenorhabdus sp. 12]|uniref:Uncharacterized protein n=1 Tax=Xenorhabdus santafensis TaxID=2582833 RepID=A0ABU4S7X0_9GAMM|nr:hypothetical protein [Xenorhabdus sp. 12]MDX7986880.1 hypothetical protein [Xenorhabdus sp. 12]